MATHNELCELILCPYCGADPGERCVTVSGGRATYPHGARSQVVMTIWSDGFHEGQEDAVGALDSGTPWCTRYLEGIRERIRRR